ncbi:uncharacterized protein MYCFIDRAFT_210943 [Pseudocercospora fijiensis CIRAD86]|uniref:Ubiquinone biosynthesis O-methyltransferase, mitochondrial n=1 Tax=Pseudocercospora fijiensis (strain CIRAD86) TaxID=383855 RepID=M3A0K6_PSEFD|nr:uncharacterized protein MYCFIDRAFT_210943 [Pseudocercospora fijiensis CIRAD86]EME84684.1 hypothetical protein MYCFIDRAFT_210943 [Pseudocercospora fijiensis CIRAD86]
MASLSLSRHIMVLPPHIRALAMKEAFLATSARTFTRTHATYNTNIHPEPSSQSSVNATEVSHFNTLASSWWDSHGPSRLLHLMNPLRHKFIKSCLNGTPHQKLRFLDIGCGGGIFAESAARLPYAKSVTAIDPTPEVITVAKRHARQDPLLLPENGRLEYNNIPIENLPPEEQYDIITLFEVIEHIQQPSPFLKTVLRHLKPGGWLIGSTIARTGTSWFTTKFMAEEVLKMVPRGTHEWSQYIQPHEMREWARSQQELLDVSVGGDGWRQMGVVYVPGLGWKEISGSEDWGNYFFGVRRRDD